jgi:hypothetical protein
MYKIKHVPSGLYFQPHKHRGSHLSKKGKVYQTKTHGLSSALKNHIKHGVFRFVINCEKDSQVHKMTINLNWSPCSWSRNQLKLETNLNDWDIELL